MYRIGRAQAVSSHHRKRKQAMECTESEERRQFLAIIENLTAGLAKQNSGGNTPISE